MERNKIKIGNTYKSRFGDKWKVVRVLYWGHQGKNLVVRSIGSGQDVYRTPRQLKKLEWNEGYGDDGVVKTTVKAVLNKRWP